MPKIIKNKNSNKNSIHININTEKKTKRKSSKKKVKQFHSTTFVNTNYNPAILNRSPIDYNKENDENKRLVEENKKVLEENKILNNYHRNHYLELFKNRENNVNPQINEKNIMQTEIPMYEQKDNIVIAPINKKNIFGLTEMPDEEEDLYSGIDIKNVPIINQRKADVQPTEEDLYQVFTLSNQNNMYNEEFQITNPVNNIQHGEPIKDDKFIPMINPDDLNQGDNNYSMINQVPQQSNNIPNAMEISNPKQGGKIVMYDPITGRRVNRNGSIRTVRKDAGKPRIKKPPLGKGYDPKIN